MPSLANASRRCLGLRLVARYSIGDGNQATPFWRLGGFQCFSTPPTSHSGDDSVDNPNLVRPPVLDSSAASAKWRKEQLAKVERKIKEPSTVVESDEELQPMWAEMESRVTKRRPRTKTGDQPTGRSNVKRTDEEFWLREGVYEGKDESKEK